LKRRNLLVVVTLAFVAPIFANFVVWLPVKSVADQPSWLGFFGNYFGGIMGGVVAYFVTRIQLVAQKESENIRLYVDQLPALVGIDLELKKLIKLLTGIDIMERDWYERAGKVYRQPSVPIWDVMDVTTTFHGLAAPSEQNWNGLWYIKNPTLLADLIKLKEFYVEFHAAITSKMIPRPPIEDDQTSDIYLAIWNRKSQAWGTYYHNDYHAVATSSQSRVVDMIQKAQALMEKVSM
jgi:hypothetical protein